MLVTGEKAPSVVLPDVHGKVTTLAGPVLLAIFKVSCPTCQLTLPFLERLALERVPVVGISQDNASVTKEFAAHFQLTFPILIDAPPYAVSNGFRITNVPSLFLIQEDGTIQWDSVGFLRKELEDLGHKLHVAVFRSDDKIPERKPG